MQNNFAKFSHKLIVVISTSVHHLSGKFIKRSTLISARTTIEAVQILKEQTFVGFDSISVNSIRPQQ